MPYSNHFDFLFLPTKELAHCLCLGLDGAGRSLLHKDITILTVLEGEEHKVNSLFETHYEAGHLGLCEGDKVFPVNMLIL